MKYSISVIFFLVIVVLLCSMIIRRLVKGRIYFLDELFIAIDALLKRGFDGGFLIIKRWSGSEFLQFKKYENKEQGEGIEFVFPRAEWSFVYYEFVKKYCNSNEIQFTEVKSNLQDGMVFLVVDFGSDVQHASDFAAGVFSEVFSVKRDEKLSIRLENARLS